MPSSRSIRLASAVTGVAFVAGATGVVVHQRDQAAAEHRAELAAATSTLTAEVRQVRHVVAAPAHDAQQSTAALRVLVAEAITGSDRAPADVQADVARVADELRAHADRLSDAATTPLPDRPDLVEIAGVDPLFARLEPLEDQVADVAEHLRASADQVERLAAAVTALQQAATDYAASTGDLPTGDDPDVHATAWRAERERLATYRAAVDEAAGHPALDEVAAAHAGLLDALEALAADALAELEADDIEGYNARVFAGVDDGAVTAWREGLAAGADAALAASAIGHLDQSRALVLGLVKELDNVRRSSQVTVEG